MQRFLTSCLLVNDKGHSGTSLVESVLALGLRVETTELGIARNALGGLSIEEALDAATAPEQFVRAWDAIMVSMARREHNDSVGLLIALSAMTIALRDGRACVSKAIAARGWNAERTASEAAMRLFGTAFNMGRRLVPDRQHRDIGRALLVEAVATSAHVKAAIHNAMAQQRYHGMRGVSYLLLARGEFSPSKLALLEASSKELAVSRKLGDRTAQHSEYAIEILLRRNQIKPSAALLIEAEAVLNEVGLVSRRLAYNAGDVYLTLGIDAMANGLHDVALVAYQQAVDAYSAGLTIPRRQWDMSDGDIRSKRGYARVRKQFVMSQLAVSTSIEELDATIEDLECGEIDPHTGLSPLPEALLLRAVHLRSVGDLNHAIQDLSHALNIAPLDGQAPEVSAGIARVRCQLAECYLEQALKDTDTSAVEAAVRRLLAADAESDPSIPLLANGIRRIVADRGCRLAAPLIRDTVSKLRTLMNRPHCTGTARAFAASYTAGVQLRLGNLINEAELRHVCELYTGAIAGAKEAPAPEVLGLAAEAKIRLAKTILPLGSGAEEGRLLLEDAIELLKMGIAAVDRASYTFNDQVAHSKLGEALLRLGSLSGEVQHAEAAAHHLERSRSLGNDAPEMFGLLGDCYYRIGRAKGNVGELRRAADQKASARHRAAETAEHDVSLRENWSLTARIEESIWEYTGNPTSMRAAIDSGLQAHVSDPKWPWPLFQLAAMRRSFGEGFNDALTLNDNLKGADSRLEGALRQQTAESLEEIGAMLAVQDEEFRRRIIGGRSKVYVLDDPHGLLSEAIVLKPTKVQDADREAENARSFAGFLRTCGAAEHFSVARPLAVVPLGGSDAVYAMQHVKGRELGSFIVRGVHLGRPLFWGLFHRVVDLLAWFHAWSWKRGIGTGPKPPHELYNVAKSIGSSWTEAGSSKVDAERLRSLLVNVLPAWAVNLRKKDAHPENWLITPANQVVLIDMESTKLLPAFYDFCQLVDDYPVISVDESGMQQRRDLLAKYHHYLGERIADIGTQQLVEGDSWAVLCGFILFRAAFGFARLARQRNNPSKSTTSSALRSAAMRRQHYVNLIAWFARNGPCAPVVACARHLAVMLERLDPRTA